VIHLYERGTEVIVLQLADFSVADEPTIKFSVGYVWVLLAPIVEKVFNVPETKQIVVLRGPGTELRFRRGSDQ
jgi:hypothetical protein